jgi:hypothetical protein
MLTRLDETLRHQLPTTFDHVATSDPRFYDRYWFTFYDPTGRLAVNTSMGLYANMNVLDGYFAVQTPNGEAPGTTQRSFRFSRALRPEIDDTAVGPLSVEVVEPYRRVRVTAAPSDHPVAFELEWSAFLPPKEEHPHFRRERGRIVDDYTRYTQVGRANGAITVDGRTTDVRDWFAPRDHSWGVRPGVAGPDPVTGAAAADARAHVGFVFFWLPFASDNMGGHVQMHLLGNGQRVYLDGHIAWPDGREVAVVDASLDRVAFHDGTRRYHEVEVTLKDASGATHVLQCEDMLRNWAMDSLGYDLGWEDGQGFGAYRGESYKETSVDDLTHPEDVVGHDGIPRNRPHREGPARVTVDGAPGMGHLILIATGPVPVLGL